MIVVKESLKTAGLGFIVAFKSQLFLQLGCNADGLIACFKDIVIFFAVCSSV